MKVAAIALCVIAVAALGTAIRDIVLDTTNAQRGWALRAVAVLAFLLAVVLNTASR
jgi:uncharacterized membrane protein